MEMKELQQKADEIINAIDNKLNVKHNSNSTALHLVEEIGELIREINKPNIRNQNIDDNLKDEIADVLLLTTKLANIHNINLEKAIIDKIEKLKQRHNISQ